jgi:hypothetical protein
MSDFSHLPTEYGNAEVTFLTGNGNAAGEQWIPWLKPRGKSMADFLLVGRGGNGGTGVIGANSTAAGGGGGGSGGQTRVTMPLHLLPDVLYISLAGVSLTSAPTSYISLYPRLAAGAGAPLATEILAAANGGGNGGNASGATAGAAGTGAAVATSSAMAAGIAWGSAIAGAAGIIGGTTATAANLILPTTGLIVTGGTGGGGLPAAATAGTSGGSITGNGNFIPTISGGVGSATATNPAQSGQYGIRLHPKARMHYYLGGAGGASTHGTATGGGLVQSSGGDGELGCGGGGTGGALTGSAAGVIGRGGAAFCIITCW